MKEILFKPDEVKFIKHVFDYAEKAMTVVTPVEQKFFDKILHKIENAEKRIKVSSAKGKGRNLQYWVCEKIAKMFNTTFDQSDDDSLVLSRPMGQHGTDIILKKEISDKFPFDIECKCCESLSIPEWVRQAKANTKENHDWLVVFKKKTIGSEPLVLMDWATFEKIINKGLNND